MNAARLGLSVAVLPSLPDIDTFQDLERLWREEADDCRASLANGLRSLRSILDSKGAAVSVDASADASPARRPRFRRSDLLRIAYCSSSASRSGPRSTGPGSPRPRYPPAGSGPTSCPWDHGEPSSFVTIYALRGVLPIIPVGVLSLAGGLAYGPWWGAAALLAGANLGSCLAFLLARYLGRGFLERFSWLRKGPIHAIDDMSEKAGFRLILFVRLIPLFQYDVVNFGAGLSRMRFRDYFLGTLIGMAPAGLIAAQLGSSLTHVASLRFVVALGLFILLILAPTIYKAWAGHRSKAKQ